MLPHVNELEGLDRVFIRLYRGGKQELYFLMKKTKNIY